MFVRCSIDDEKYSRDYAIGKVKSIDEFSELLEIQFFDVTGIGDFYPKPENQKTSNIVYTMYLIVKLGLVQ